MELNTVKLKVIKCGSRRKKKKLQSILSRKLIGSVPPYLNDFHNLAECRDNRSDEPFWS